MIDYSPGSEGARASALYQRTIPLVRNPDEIGAILDELRSMGSIGQGYALVVEAEASAGRGDLDRARMLYVAAFERIPTQLHFLRDYCALLYRCRHFEDALRAGNRVLEVAQQQDNATYTEEGAFWVCRVRSKLGLPLQQEILDKIADTTTFAVEPGLLCKGDLLSDRS